MKKSSKLWITLGSITGAVVLLATGLSVGLVMKAKPKKELAQQIQAFELELESNSKLNESQKTEIKKVIDDAKKVLNSDKSSNINFREALSKLVSQVSEIRKKSFDSKPDLLLSEAKKIYESKLNEANELLTMLSNDEYKEIKTKLESSINLAKKEISDKSTKEQYENATKSLISAIETANSEKQSIDVHNLNNSNKNLENAKEEYDKVISKANELIKTLEAKPEYATIKKTLEEKVNKNKKTITESSSKDEFLAATNEINDAINQAKAEKKKIDNKSKTDDTKKAAKDDFYKLENEIKEFIKTLKKPEQDGLKNKLEAELNKQKSIVDQENTTSRKVKDITKSLKKFFEQIKRDAQKADTTEETLTAEQKALVEKIKNKTILNNSAISEDVKKAIIEIYKSPKSHDRNEHVRYFFGYLSYKRPTKGQEPILQFSENSKGKKKDLGNLFAKEFMDLINRKDVLYAGSNSRRKALCLELKEDGKVVLPFKFKGSDKIYEIELFTSDELKKMTNN
ncbi:hypothetical protein [Mycoplasma sp. 125]|uniref:hypothetical protein n=1 Tax=Mycoplasma sp. 125 TaxID=3447505 RepID=UPI003F658BF3